MKRLPGLIALTVIVGVVGAALTGLASAGGDGDLGSWAYLRRLIGSAALQAGLSALIALVLGAAIALALARRQRFFGRGLLVAALNGATVLPAIVTVFAVAAVFGSAGWLADALGAVGVGYGSWIYGLQGVLIAHAILNAPLAARVFLAALAATPSEHWRLAAGLGMPPGAVFRFIDWPVLRREAAGIGALVFLACFTSFAIVLALGGGPRVSTLEVAIFEAVRFEADFRRAALLALVQLGLTVVVLAPLLILFGRRVAETGGAGVVALRPDAAARSTTILDRVVLVATVLFIGAPLATIAVRGLAAVPALFEANVATALLTSLAIGVPAGALSLLLALALAGLARTLRVGGGRRRADLVGVVALAVLVVSPLALSAGLFVVLRPVIDPFASAAPLIAIVNALMTLPFTYRQVEPPLTLSAERYSRLADSLAMRGLSRLLLVDWPLLRGPAIVAFAMATALSLGDLGVAAFFGTGQLTTLPLLLYERLGAYRSAEAASVALLLTLLVIGLFLVAQRFAGGDHARAR